MGTCSSKHPSALLSPSEKMVISPELNTCNYFVVKFVSATGLPKDGMGHFLKAWIHLGDKCISKECRTLTRDGDDDPIWNSYQNFRIFPPKGAILHLEVHEIDIMESNVIGTCNIPVGDISTETSTFFEVRKVPGQAYKCKKISVQLQRFFHISPPPRQKTFYLVRHGESKWNYAQDHKDVVGMIMHNDHALTKKGIEQAAALNSVWKKEKNSENELNLSLKDFSATKFRQFYSQTFLKATHVFSSPLTRAVQTALQVMEDHPSLRLNGLSLLRYLYIINISSFTHVDSYIHMSLLFIFLIHFCIVHTCNF